MKKILALLSAAVMIFTVAGCVNKNEPETTGAVQNDTAQSETPSAETQPEDESDEHSVTEETGTVAAEATTQPHTKRPTITQYTTRQTSPNHLTTRPTTTQRTTILITVPTRTQAQTTQRTTKAAVTRTTAPPSLEVVTTTRPMPKFTYGGEYSVKDEKGTSTVKIASHTCTESKRGTYEIYLTVNILRHESSASNIRIGYNCYNKKGEKINEEMLWCDVPLIEQSQTSMALATATLDTVTVEFAEYIEKTT